MRMLRAWIPLSLLLAAVLLLLVSAPRQKQTPANIGAKENTDSPVLTRNGVTRDMATTDEVVIGGDILWFPKRYAIVPDDPGSWTFGVYWPDLEPQTADDRHRVDIRLIDHTEFPYPQNSADKLRKLIESVDETDDALVPVWNADLSLFEFVQDSTRYLYSEDYRVSHPRRENFAIECQLASKEFPESCGLGYWATPRQFVEYRFDAELLPDWKSIDLGIRRLLRAARLKDGEVRSLGADIGYDDTGRHVVLVGYYALHIPTTHNPASSSRDPMMNSVQITLCWPKNEETGECPGWDNNAIIRIHGGEKKVSASIDDGVASLKEAYSHYKGPFETEIDGVWGFRNTETGPDLHYALVEPNDTGRHPIARCSSGPRCSSRIIVVPGLFVKYDFGKKNLANWPQLHERVRGLVRSFLIEE